MTGWAPPAGTATVRRCFWCRQTGRDVEVEFVASGPPGFRTLREVRRCPAFDPTDAITCARECLSVGYRVRWVWPEPSQRLLVD